MVKDHSDTERGNLQPHGLLFPINSKGYFFNVLFNNALNTFLIRVISASETF